MNKILSVFLILFMGIGIFAKSEGELEYPKIINVKYNLIERKSKEFLDVDYLVEIQGAYKDYSLLLEVNLYNSDKQIIKIYKQIVEIKKSEFQVFTGTKLIQYSIAEQTKFVGAKLKTLKKSY